MMGDGSIFDGEKISELVREILTKFAEEGLSVDESKCVLRRASELAGQFSVVKITDLQDVQEVNP